MRMWIVAVVIAAVLNPMTARQSVAATTGRTQRVYWGAYIDGGPWSPTKLATFESLTGKGLGIVHWGQPWWRNGAYARFDAVPMNAVRSHGSIPLLDWGSWDYSQGPNQPTFQLSDIISGNHDAFIKQWATDARNWGHPLFLRFDWEMNGNWSFPWSEQLNGNQPGQYVKAWRHVHDIFVQVGATNVTWVWNPNTDYPGATSLASLYPGDAYVDWTAMDGYNWGVDKGGWQSFTQIFATTYAQLLQLAPTKPIMLGETASSEDGGSKAAWLTDALSVQLPQAFPKIKALVWMNWNCGDTALEWPLESSSASTAAAKIALASSYFASNQFATLNVAPIPPN